MIRDDVKNHLLLHTGEYISGEELSKELKVTRNAVWKAVKQLRQDGYEIEAVSNRGYRLSGADVLDSAEIEKYLHTEFLGKRIQILKSVDSTNNLCKAMAQQGAGQGLVILAEQQTQGRGRLGKSFSSPARKGIYMSILLRPKTNFADISLITVASALAVCRAIENICSFSPQIKWVNDIYYQGRKICGILTEATIEAESGSLGSVINGIGINVNTDPEHDFPDEVAEIAQSLSRITGKLVNRNRLIAEVLNQLEVYYTMFVEKHQERLIDEYRSRLFMLGRSISVIENDHNYPAEAVDIDALGRLIVRDRDGNLKTLNAGEISIRI